MKSSSAVRPMAGITLGVACVALLFAASPAPLAAATQGASAAATQGSIVGVVVDSRTKAPLAGARVRVNGLGLQGELTAADGTFRVSAPGGSFTLTVTRVGYAERRTGYVHLTSGGLAGYVRVELTEIGSIRGSVVSAANGLPLAGVSVMALTADAGGGGGKVVLTDSTGAFRLDLDGSYILSARKVGYISITTPAFTVAGTAVVPAGTLSLTPTPIGNVTGLVKTGTGSNKRPVAGAVVALRSDSGLAAATDSQGAYTLTDVPVGSQALDVAAEGYFAATTAPVTVTTGTATAPEVSLTPELGSITGIVRDAQASGAPLQNASVVVDHVKPSIIVKTAIDGSFTLTGVPAGKVCATPSNAPLARPASKSASRLTHSAIMPRPLLCRVDLGRST